MYGRFNKFLTIAAASSLALSLAAASAEAKTYTRSCKATFLIGVTTVGGARLSEGRAGFIGKGTVKIYAPNTARKRARENIDECISAAWAGRNSTGLPNTCSTGNQVYNYPYPNGLRAGLTAAACRTNPGYDHLRVNLSVLFDGDTGCIPDNRWSQIVAQRYLVDCTSFTETPLH